MKEMKILNGQMGNENCNIHAMKYSAVKKCKIHT